MQLLNVVFIHVMCARIKLCGIIIAMLLTFGCSSQKEAGFPALTIDARSEGRPISPYIYGIDSAPSAEYIKAGGFRLIRWGATWSSTYNWKVQASNNGIYWYFSNTRGNKYTPCDFMKRGAGAGAAVYLTVPALGWVAKDTTSYSFSVVKYGPQQATNPNSPDAGNGIRPNGQPVVGTDPTDSMVRSFATRRGNEPPESVFMDEWMESLRENCRDAQATFFAIDNEPEIWHVAHRGVRPFPAGYEEILHTFLEYARTVKTVNPDWLVTGPVTNSWYNYWTSEKPGDKAAHGGEDFLPWFLKQVRKHDLAWGRRSLYVLDVHFYPSELFWSNRTDPKTNAVRLRATRLLWDSTYTDETNLTSSAPDHHQGNPKRPMIIPRLLRLIEENYPGTLLGISEWNFGGGHTINGGLATAEALGIMGREGVFLASHFQGPRGYPEQHWPSFQAFCLFRNADGKGTGFGDRSLPASSTDWGRISVFAARDQRNRTLTVVVINKEPEHDITARLDVKGFDPAKRVSVFRLSASNPDRVLKEPELSIAGPVFDVTFPRYSATLLVLHEASSK